VEVISNGRNKQPKVVLAISLVKGVSWVLGLEFDSPSGIFWGIENPTSSLCFSKSNIPHRPL
jgi:hypothetical protein